MGDKIREKLMYEYEIFFLDCMRLSRSGVYARSGEIELKKQLIIILRKKLAEDNMPYAKLLQLDNILEEIYRYAKDYENLGLSLEKVVQKWLDEMGVILFTVGNRI